MDISSVDKFGAVDADTDELLLECFQDHEAYIEARDHRKFLIVGRKGSGKTAIYRKLIADKTDGKFCHGHSFSDYPWFHHDKQKKTGVPDSECFRYSWEYVILISIAKVVINDAADPWNDEALDAMSRLESFIVDTYGTRTPELNRIFSPETKLKLKPSLTAGWGPLKATVSAERVEMDSLPLVVYEVNEALMDSVIKSLNPDYSYHICFDELDRGFDANDENYRLRLSGLLIAARDFNKRLRLAGKKMSVIVFLRDDILRYLKFEDKNKIVDDFSAIIEWDKSNSSRTLKDIMSKRFSKVLNIEESGAWEAVFDESSRMPGQQTKYQYILDRTFKRPRDIIKFANETLKAYKQSRSSSPKFDNSHVIGARQEHSKYIRRELVDEMHQHFPKESSAFDLLRSIGYMSFTLSRISESHAELAAKIQDFPACSTILRQLHTFSVVAFLKVGGAGGGSEWQWRYEDTDSDYDERATIFRVHPALKENLGLKQGRALGTQEEGTDPLLLAAQMTVPENDDA